MNQTQPTFSAPLNQEKTEDKKAEPVEVQSS